MKITVLEATPDAEEVACRAARNDYMTDWVGGQDFDEVMESVEGDDLSEKKDSLIEHLMRRGHYGPFEHPHITFAVEGVSRITMAQITRHRHASFDIQSLRYTKPELGVTAHPEIHTLPATNEVKRKPISRYARNQERKIAEWRSRGVPDDALTEILDIEKQELKEISRESGGTESEDGKKFSLGIDDSEIDGRVAGYLDGKLSEGVVREDVVETEFLTWVSDRVGGELFSPLGDYLYLVFDSEGLSDKIDTGVDLEYVTGVWEASGGIYTNGDEKAYIEGDDLQRLREVLEGEDVEVSSREGWIEMDADEFAAAMYDSYGVEELRKISLLQSLDASEEVEERYGSGVSAWLNSQQFIYPPSVTENEVVSRESGRTRYDTPIWVRMLELMRGYVDQSETYNRLLDRDVPAEDARAVLGMGIKINMVFTMNARALMHLFDMRAAGDAQWEVRHLSEALIQKSKEWMPNVFEYYDENMKNRRNRLGP